MGEIHWFPFFFVDSIILGYPLPLFPGHRVSENIKIVTILSVNWPMVKFQDGMCLNSTQNIRKHNQITLIIYCQHYKVSKRLDLMQFTNRNAVSKSSLSKSACLWTRPLNPTNSLAAALNNSITCDSCLNFYMTKTYSFCSDHNARWQWPIIIFITFNASNCEKTLDFQQKNP